MKNQAVQNRTLQKRHVSTQKRQKVRVLQKQAIDLFEQSRQEHLDALTVNLRLEQAKSNIILALKTVPEDTNALNLLSRILLEQGAIHESEQVIKEALELEANNGSLWYSYGNIALVKHQLEKAENRFRLAIQYSAKETKAEFFLAYSLLEQGKQIEAFRLYRELAKTNRTSPHIRAKLLECATQLVADVYDEELEHDLLTYLNWSDVNTHHLSNLVCTLLEKKFSVTKEGCQANAQEIATDRLFLAALHHVHIKSPVLERLIMALRYELLLTSSQQSKIDGHYYPLAKAIACYCIQNGFLLLTTDAEDNMQLVLSNLIDTALSQKDCTLNDILGSVLLYSMYSHWSQLDNTETLIELAIQENPAELQEITELHSQRRRRSSIDVPKLNTIVDLDSFSLKEQYEAYPYPQWQYLDYKRSTQYSQALLALYPSLAHNWSLNNETTRVLVAGCGTGRHALHVAKYFRGVDVTAIDLSKASLAFAKSKAQQLDIRNIQFYQADILELKPFEDTFHIVECSGVLHHIHNENQALENMLKQLKPNGLIKLALYSKRARNLITQVRDLFNKGDIQANKHKLSVVRQAIIESDTLEGKQYILNSDDFYTLAGVVDMLFNKYERLYTPIDIQRLCHEHNLQFLGFSSLTPKNIENFNHFHKNKADIRDLEQWEAYEKTYPESFSSMYQFYCQAK